MLSVTIRNAAAKLVKSLKTLARRRRTERQSVLQQIEAGWQQQTRRPTAAEIDAWIGAGRS